MWEKIIEVEVELRNEADVVSGARIDGNHRFGADLEILARPDDAGIDGSGSQPALPTVEWITKGKLHQWNQAVERRAQPDVSDLLLQVNETVFDRKTPLQHSGVW